MTRLTDLPRVLAHALLRGVLLLAGLVFALSLLIAGLLAAAGVLLWSLLRGRRPEMKLHRQMFRTATARGFGAAHRPSRAQDDDVVDVEVREIAPTRLPSGR